MTINSTTSKFILKVTGHTRPHSRTFVLESQQRYSCTTSNESGILFYAQERALYVLGTWDSKHIYPFAKSHYLINRTMGALGCDYAVTDELVNALCVRFRQLRMRADGDAQWRAQALLLRYDGGEPTTHIPIVTKLPLRGSRSADEALTVGETLQLLEVEASHEQSRRANAGLRSRLDELARKTQDARRKKLEQEEAELEESSWNLF